MITYISSQVPHKSLNQAHAASMPDTTHAVTQVTHEFIPSQQRHLVLISSVCFSTRHLQFTFVRLLDSYLVSLMTLFNIDAHYLDISFKAARCSLKLAPVKPVSKGPPSSFV